MYIDEYKIKASEEVTMTGRDEVRINMDLQKNEAANTGSIRGTVSDENGDPIGGATVKLCLGSTLDPYDHTNTNPQGKYLFNQVPVGSYQIAAIKEGYLMPLAISLSVVKNQSTQVDITLLEDPDAEKNIVYGIVKSSTDNLPINNATAQLYKTELPEDVLFATVGTNEHGQYYFVDVDDGEYYVKVSKEGYYTTDSAKLPVESKEYAAVDVSMAADPDSNTGVICGVISDEVTELPVGNASIALYEISGEIETLIKLTETSVEGRYIFGNILPGTYRVKATVQTEE